jgi:hypothetical protein
MRFPVWLIFIAIFVVGTPIVAMLINMSMGSWTATGIEHDGSVTQISFDRAMRRPDWVALPSGAGLVEASHVENERQRRDVCLMSFSTRQPTADTRDFYRTHLSRAGFAVIDLGTGPMNARTAAYLGVADILSASRPTTGDQISVTNHTPEGLLATALVELKWGRFVSPRENGVGPATKMTP